MNTTSSPGTGAERIGDRITDRPERCPSQRQEPAPAQAVGESRAVDESDVFDRSQADPPGICLTRDDFGQLLLARPGGQTPVVVVPVRAFPLSAPAHDIALIDADGQECQWLDDLSALAPAVRTLIEEELAARGFTPEIRHILSVSPAPGASCWHVLTDRGETRFTLRAGETVRRLAHGMLQLVDENGVPWLVRNADALDARSRRLLERHR